MSRPLNLVLLVVFFLAAIESHSLTIVRVNVFNSKSFMFAHVSVCLCVSVCVGVHRICFVTGSGVSVVAIQLIYQLMSI